MNAPVSAPTPALTIAVGRYRLDPARTTVRFHTRHLFGLGAVSGTVWLREADINVAETLTATRVHATLDAASFHTGHRKRDTDVRSAKYLDVTGYPDITFDSQQVRQHEGKLVVAGTVTAHGVGAPAEITVDELDEDNAGELMMRVSVKIDRYAHHVTAGKGMAARWLTLDITTTAIRDDTDD